MIARIKSEITLWRVIVAIIFVTGLYATYVRFFEGFRASTNLSDQMPWGLWVGLGTLCGIGLSPAGFGISDADFIPRLPDRHGRISIRDRPAVALLAPHRDVEPPLGLVRCVHLHHDLHDGVDLRVCTGGDREAAVEGIPRDDIALSPQDPDRCRVGWRAAVVDAPVLSGRALPDRTRQDSPPVVFAIHACVVLSVGHSRWTGTDRDGHLSLHAFAEGAD